MELVRPGNPKTAGERLPAIIPADCIGMSCPNFRGVPCTDSKMEWMRAGRPGSDQDKSVPPLRGNTTYIIYGQMCLSGSLPQLIAQRVEVLKPEEVDPLIFVRLTSTYGTMPVDIIRPSVADPAEAYTHPEQAAV